MCSEWLVYQLQRLQLQLLALVGSDDLGCGQTSRTAESEALLGRPTRGEPTRTHLLDRADGLRVSRR